MAEHGIKVGELARRSGVSVRALHYYDQIGLLSPRRHGDGEHRLYRAKDVARLHQIVSLRQLGLPLETIRECLAGTEPTLHAIIERHLARLEEQLQLQELLRERLRTVAASLRQAEEVSVDEFLKTIAMITTMEDYYTPEQRRQLRERAIHIGDPRIREVQEAWRDLLAAVRAEMDRGTDPTEERVLNLARRWQGLIDEFTGGDPGIEQSLRRLNTDKPQILQNHGFEFDTAMMDYIGKAMQALRDCPDGGAPATD